jgi:hypothetical protein
MKNAQSSPGAPQSSTPGNPRQFRIIDLFALTTLAALVSAMAAPFARAMPREHLTKFLVVAFCQLLVVATAIVLAAHSRNRLLQASGERIGIAYCGALKWAHWPLFKSISYMLLLAAAQLTLAVSFALFPIAETPTPHYIVFQLQLGYFAGLSFTRFLWKVYPNAIEFFDHGLALGGTKLVRWDQVEVRRSQLFTDRVVVVVRPEHGSIAGLTRTAQFPSWLMDKLLATQLAARAAKRLAPPR